MPAPAKINEALAAARAAADAKAWETAADLLRRYCLSRCVVCIDRTARTRAALRNEAGELSDATYPVCRVCGSFVYRPGGVDDGQVYASFANLCADTQKRAGAKVVVIDGDGHIPPGTYDLSGVTLKGK